MAGSTSDTRSGGTGGTMRGVIGADSGTRNESFATVAVTPISSGRVCAVTSYGRSGGPFGYCRRSG